MKKINIAIIAGKGFKTLFKEKEKLRLETPYGVTYLLSIDKIDNKEVVFLPRHGLTHSSPPHKINYRANIYALHMIGVERIIAINAVGALNRNFRPGDIVIPHDFIDFTKLRFTTFYDKAPVTHIDLSQPYCPEIRKLLVQSAWKTGIGVWDKAVLVCTEGPRFETPAEIEMFRQFGCDIVGMTSIPETVLARELEICYAAACYVSNMAAGMQESLALSEVSKIFRQIMSKIEQALIETVKVLPITRKEKCTCASALKDARFN